MFEIIDRIICSDSELVCVVPFIDVFEPSAYTHFRYVRLYELITSLNRAHVENCRFVQTERVRRKLSVHCKKDIIIGNRNND